MFYSVMWRNKDHMRQSTHMDTREIRVRSEWTLIEMPSEEICHKQSMALLNAPKQLFTDATFRLQTAISLINLIDSYGPAPGAQTMMYNTAWFGSHEQCMQSRVTLQSNQDDSDVFETCYCVANFHSPQWSHINSRC